MKIFISAVFMALAPLTAAHGAGEGAFSTANPQLPEIAVSHEFSAEAVNPGSRFKGAIYVTIPEGWHVYAPGVEKYRKLEVRDGEGPVTDMKYSYPPGHEMDIIGEIVPVYDGTVSITVEGVVARGAAAGREVWKPVVSFQACSDNLCLTPESRTLEIVLQIGGGG